ncbi:MAG TPA: proprotein convertase P-domain-containing protein [Phycisphaerae bacterium]|nr:proprotein convertase P-domain-containing protein [Phycisphaerae bacterium]
MTIRKNHRAAWTVIATVCLFVVAGASQVRAAYPPPPNDTSATAETVGALPAILHGSNVRGNDSISATTIGGLDSVPGPDVFYSFTPGLTGSYWLMMIPWDQVPVYGSSGATVPAPNLCLYVRRKSDGVFIGGSDANPRDQVDTVIAGLTSGVEYEIVIDSTSDITRISEFEFMLVVAEAPSGPTEDCTNIGVIPSANLPYAAVGTLTGAVNDVTFSEGSGRCDVSNTSGLASAGPDHVYEFTTGPDPSDAGEYVFNLMPAGAAWNGYIYLADSCPPFLPLGCLGAASHTSSATRQSETIVVTLDFDKTYYVVVDAAAASTTDGKYVLLVDRAEGHGITEVEPNDTSAFASPLVTGQRNGGQIAGANDVDLYSFTAAAQDRLYAFLDNGNVFLSSIDIELRLVNTNGSTVMELDDDDGEGSSASVNTLVQRSSAFSAAIAGAILPAGGTYFLRANAGSAIDTIARYFVHYGIEPGSRAPSPECEPNNSLASADGSGKAYYSGVIAASGDVDYFAFEATAGDQVFIALDGDPERDSGGDADNDPQSLDGALVVYDPVGDALITDHDDPNLVGAGQIPDYPAEALAFRAPTTGTYKVQVSGGAASDFGAERTYRLAIFRGNAAPSLTEGVDPVIDSITPDFGADTLAVVASDDAGGDTGICALSLSPDSVNLAISATFTPGDSTVSFDVELITPGMSGYGKLIVTDCAGNTACAYIQIDADDPVCGGSAGSAPRRTFHSTHAPLHAPNNQPTGPGVIGTIDVPAGSPITDVTVTITIETIRPADVDVFLESPMGTIQDIVTDRGGGTSGFDITLAAFTNNATEMMSTDSNDAPYTGSWLPDGVGGMSVFDGQNPAGTWKLNVRDDDSSAGGGCRLVRWSLDIEAGFAAPQEFQGTVTDTAGVNGGIASVVMSADTNVTFTLDPDFVPGDLTTTYTVTLINPSLPGSCTITATDLSDNECQTLVNLNGLTDSTPPANSGAISRNIEISQEVLATVPQANPAGVVSTVSVPDGVVVGEVEVDITVDTLDVGRNASTVSHGGAFASLINRVGMDERDSVGLTKDNIEITLDDDAPVVDDAHEEPALGTIEFLGAHQPDGRGEFVGNGITSDYRDNMLFALEGLDSAGDWSLYVSDNRLQGASGAHSEFRRWAARLLAPGAPERYVGTARDTYPESGICSITVGGGSINLSVASNFTAGDSEASYAVSLVDPSQPGSGTVEITDCAGNTTVVPIALAAALADQNLPIITGAVNPATLKFEGAATDNQPGDSGIASVTLAPYSDNLQIALVEPDPPSGAGSVDVVVSLITPGVNGRGYLRVTDVTGYRRHALIHIDAVDPLCSGAVSNSKRYRSTDLPAPIPDLNPGGVSSTIAVADLAPISDVDVTINITHGFDGDIDLSMTSPTFITLFGDIGLTGNDFFNTTIDDEAPFPIPDASAEAPFTGRYQPAGGPALFVLDGGPAAGSYSLHVADDAVFNVGTFESWSLTISSAGFPERFAGEATDSELLGLGIGSIELLPGSCNVALGVDPFTPGDKLVLFEVTLVDPQGCGRGTVRVSDLGGNSCDQVVALNGAFCDPGDVNHSGAADFDDIEPFAAALLAGDGNCETDMNLDGKVDGLDVQGFTDELVP